MTKYLLTNEAAATERWYAHIINQSYSEDLTTKAKVGKSAAGTYFKFRPGVTVTSSGDFPDISLAKSGWRPQGALNGKFANASWTFKIQLESDTKYGFSVKMAVRISRSSNADGSSATLIGVYESPNTIDVPASAGGRVSDSWTGSPGELTITDQYIFFEYRLVITTGGGSSTTQCSFACDENPASYDESVDTAQYTYYQHVHTNLDTIITRKYTKSHGLDVKIIPNPTKQKTHSIDARLSGEYEFGNSSTTYQTTGFGANFKYASAFTSGIAGKLVEIKVHCSVSDGGIALVRGVLYASSGGEPGARLAYSNTHTMTRASSGWESFLMNYDISASTQYCIGIQVLSLTGSFYYSYIQTSTIHYNSDSADPPADPFGSHFEQTSHQLSVLAHIHVCHPEVTYEKLFKVDVRLKGEYEFGNSDASNTTVGMGANYKYVAGFQSDSAGKLVEIKVNCYVSTGGSATVRAVLYGKSGAEPGARLAYSATHTLTRTTQDWESFTMSYNLAGLTTYFIGIQVLSLTGSFYFGYKMIDTTHYNSDSGDPPSDPFGSHSDWPFALLAVLGHVHVCYPDVSTYEKTWTTDLLMKKLTQKTDSVDTLIKKLNATKTANADALFVWRTPKTTALDTDLKKEWEKLYQEDLLLKKEWSKVLSEDVLIKKEWPKATAADALIKQLDIAKADNLDLILKLPVSKTFALDLLLWKTISKTVGLDMILGGGATYQKQWALDLLQVLRFTPAYTLDTIFYGPRITWYVDIFMVNRYSLSYGADLVMSQTHMMSSAFDLMIGLVNLTKLTAIDLIVKKIGVHNIGVDTLIRILNLTKSFSFDTYMVGRIAKTLQIDALLRKQQAIDNQYDLLIRKETERSMQMDLLMLYVPIREFALNVLLQGFNYTRTFGLDTFLGKWETRTKDWNADTLFQWWRVKSYASDMLIGRTVPKNYPVDLMIRDTFEPSYGLDTFWVGTSTPYNVDLLLQTMLEGNLNMDVLIQKIAQSKDTLVDAVIQLLGSKQLSFDTVITGWVGKLYGLDMLLEILLTKDTQIDTVITKRGVLDHGLDSVIKGVLQALYNADVCFRQTYNPSHALDMNIVHSYANAMTMDTWFSRLQGFDYFFDTIFFGTPIKTWVMNSIITKKYVGYTNVDVIFSGFNLTRIHQIDLMIGIGLCLREYGQDLCMIKEQTTTYASNVTITMKTLVEVDVDMLIFGTLHNHYGMDTRLAEILHKQKTSKFDLVMTVKNQKSYGMDFWLVTWMPKMKADMREVYVPA